MRVLEKISALLVVASCSRHCSWPGAGSARPRVHGDRADAGLDVHRREVRCPARLAQTDPALLGRTDSTPVNVMIKYDYDATASYAGGVAGLAATSPRVTGKSLKDNTARRAARTSSTPTSVSSKITAAVEKAVPGAEDRHVVPDGLRRRRGDGPANQVADLLEGRRRRGGPDGHARAAARPTQHRRSSARPTVWPSLGGSDHAGANVIVGVLDTGIWPEHPSFADHGLPAPPGGPYGCQFGDGSDVAAPRRRRSPATTS